jgi:hypothetical protein
LGQVTLGQLHSNSGQFIFGQAGHFNSGQFIFGQAGQTAFFSVLIIEGFVL